MSLPVLPHVEDFEGNKVVPGDHVWTHYSGRVKVQSCFDLSGEPCVKWSDKHGRWDYAKFIHLDKPRATEEDKTPGIDLTTLRRCLSEKGPGTVQDILLREELPPASWKRVHSALEALRSSGEVSLEDKTYTLREF